MTVLIIGSGPTGLVLGFLLAKNGIKVRIVDQKIGPSVHSKALGIQARTLELFEKMGVIEDFLSQGLKASSLHIHYGKNKKEIHLDYLPTFYPYILILPQSQTEQILHDHLKKWGVEVEWQTTFEGFSENQVCLNKMGIKEKVSPDWILGCDGAHSLVRHSLNLPFHGVALDEQFLLADISYQTSLSQIEPKIFLNRKGIVAFLPLPTPHECRLIFPLGKDLKETNDIHGLLKAREIDFLQIQDIKWISLFRVHRRLASCLKKGNVFLVGDAAHIHSPAGGQGMNTSIHEAYNLAWKLILQIKGVAAPNLLNSYEKERVPIAKEVLKTTTKITHVMGFLAKHGRGFLFSLFGFLVSRKMLQRKLTRTLSELWVHYKNSPIVKDEGGKGPFAGMRAPDFVLKDGSRFFEKCRGEKHVLLLFSPQPEFTKKIETLYGTWIDIWVLEEGSKVYRANEKSLFLIRPDGYIGYKSHDLKSENFLNYLRLIFNL